MSAARNSSPCAVFPSSLKIRQRQPYATRSESSETTAATPKGSGRFERKPSWASAS